MNWIIELLRSHPETAIYLTIGVGFLIAKIRIKGFSLGIVTSVLLVGVVVGQLHIPIGNTLKPVAFLMFLFAIGYKVGPQFFSGLKKEGLPQVYFAVVMCFLILLSTWVISLIMGYSAGAVIQLAEYHLSPDDDYPEFKYYEGLPYLNDFYLEVHYEGKDAQKAAIQKVLEERKKTVYATAIMKGAILVDNGIIKLLGDVEEYN